MIRRREFIGGLGSAAAWPVVAGAQQAAVPVIGYLSGRSAGAEASMLTAFREGLNTTGFVEDRNVKIQFYFADGELNRLPALAADLVRREPALIVAVGSDRPAAAARAANANIPIVFIMGFDPVLRGFVASFSRPGGNMTGVYAITTELVGKMVSLLHELVPRATTIALLQSSDVPEASLVELSNARQATAELGLRLIDFSASPDREIEAAFARMAEQRAEALLVPTKPFLISHAEMIATLAARYGLPAIYGRRNFAAAGGLISYGDNAPSLLRPPRWRQSEQAE